MNDSKPHESTKTLQPSETEEPFAMTEAEACELGLDDRMSERTAA